MMRRLGPALLLLMAFLGRESSGQSCTSAFPQAPAFPDDVSGVRTAFAPPLPIGSAVQFRCPGVKHFKGQSDWSLYCNADGSYEFRPAQDAWPVCECKDASVGAIATGGNAECANLTYSTEYAEKTKGSAPATLFEFSLPATASDWQISVTLDTGAEVVAASGATVLAKSGTEIVVASRRGVSPGKQQVRLQYALGASSPSRWQHPCVAKIACSFDESSSDAEDSALAAGVVASAAVVTVAALVAICACIVYCFREYGGMVGGARGGSRARTYSGGSVTPLEP